MRFIFFKLIVYFHNRQNRVFRRDVKIPSYYILADVPLIFADLHFLKKMKDSNLELGHTLRAAEVEDVSLW